MSVFGVDLYVMPHPINFSEDIRKISTSPVIVSFVGGLCLTYLLLVMLTRRADINDELRNVIYDLQDNSPLAQHPYMVTLYTGVRNGAGTTASVGIRLKGTKGRSQAHILTDVDGVICQTGTADSVILRCMEDLGELEMITLWHDDTGDSPDWYISHVVVQSLLDASQVWVFLCYTWLSSFSGTENCAKRFPVAEKEDLKKFKHAFHARFSYGLRDKHLWFSVLGRPHTSHFTRTQRLSCCFTLLMTTLLTSIMFFGMKDQIRTTSSQGAFDHRLVIISIQCSLIVTFPNMILVQIFRLSKRTEPVPIITHDISILREDDFKVKKRKIRTLMKKEEEIPVEWSSESEVEKEEPKRILSKKCASESTLVWKNAAARRHKRNKVHSRLEGKKEIQTFDDLVEFRKLPGVSEIIKVRRKELKRSRKFREHQIRSKYCQEGELQSLADKLDTSHERDRTLLSGIPITSFSCDFNLDRYQVSSFEESEIENDSSEYSSFCQRTQEWSHTGIYHTSGNTRIPGEIDGTKPESESKSLDALGLLVSHTGIASTENPVHISQISKKTGTKVGGLENSGEIGVRGQKLVSNTGQIHRVEEAVKNETKTDNSGDRHRPRTMKSAVTKSSEIKTGTRNESTGILRNHSPDNSGEKTKENTIFGLVQRPSESPAADTSTVRPRSHDSSDGTKRENTIFGLVQRKGPSLGVDAEVRTETPRRSRNSGQNRGEPMRNTFDPPRRRHKPFETGILRPNPPTTSQQRRKKAENKRRSTKVQFRSKTEARYFDRDSDDGMDSDEFQKRKREIEVRYGVNQNAITETTGMDFANHSNVSLDTKSSKKEIRNDVCEVEWDSSDETINKKPPRLFPNYRIIHKPKYHKSIFESDSVYSLNNIAEKPKRKGLPWWTKYLAWTVHTLASSISAFLVLMYGLSFGQELTSKWLVTISQSLSMNICLIQPVKVMVMSGIMALIMGSVEDQNLIKVHSVPWNPDDKLDDPAYEVRHRFLARRRFSDSRYRPLPATGSGEKKETGETVRVLWNAVRILLKVTVMLFLMTQHMDSNSYLAHRNLDTTMGRNFSPVMTQRDLWAWLRDSWLASLYDPTTDDDYIEQYQAYRVGPTRLRQVRRQGGLAACRDVLDVLAEGSCGDVTRSCDDVTRSCGDVTDLLTTSHDLSWYSEPLTYINSSAEWNSTRAAWYYRPQEDLDGPVLTTDYSVHFGGGFVAHFTDFNLEHQTLLNELNKLNWIDNLTMTIYSEFGLYNVNLDIYVFGFYIFDFDSTGVIMARRRFEIVPSYSRGHGQWTVLCEALYVVFVVFGIRRWSSVLRDSRKNNPLMTNLRYGALFLLQLSTILLHVGYSFQSMYLHSNTKFGSQNFAYLQNAVNLAFSIRWLIGIQTFLSMMRLVNFIGFTPRLRLFFYFSRKYWNSLLTFIVYISLIIVAFALFFYLINGGRRVDFFSFPKAVMTCVLLISRQFALKSELVEDFIDMVSIWYALFLKLIIINCLVALILTTYRREVRMGLDRFRTGMFRATAKWLFYTIGLKMVDFRKKHVPKLKRKGRDKLKKSQKLLDEKLKEGKVVLDEKLKDGKIVLDKKLKEGKIVLDKKVKEGKIVLGEKLKEGRVVLDEKLKEGKVLLDDAPAVLGAKLKEGHELVDRRTREIIKNRTEYRIVPNTRRPRPK